MAITLDYGAIKPTAEQRKIALRKHGVPWEDINYSQRTVIRQNPTSIPQSEMYRGMSLEPYLNKIKKLYLKGWSAAEIFETNPKYGSHGSVKTAIRSMKSGKAPVSISKSEMATRPTLAKTLNEAFDELKKKLKRATYQKELRDKTGIGQRALKRHLSPDKVLFQGTSPVVGGGQKGLEAAREYFKTRKVDKPTIVHEGPTGAQKVSYIRFKDANQEKKYLDFLKEKFKYPQASTFSPITNTFLRKKFGISADSVTATNSWLADKNKLKYPVADPLYRARVRSGRLQEGQKYVGGERYANINEGQEIIRDQINKYYQKYPRAILRNEKLIDALNLKLVDGAVVSKNKTAKELIKAAKREKGILDIDHIKGVRTEARNIEFPINRQLAPYNVNSGFLQSVDTYLTKNLGSTDLSVQNKISKIDGTLKKFGWRININGKMLGSELIPAVSETEQVLPNFLKNMQSLGIKSSRIPKVSGLGAPGELAATTLAAAKRNVVSTFLTAARTNQGGVCNIFRAEGGRIGFAAGSNCVAQMESALKTDPIRTTEQITKLSGETGALSKIKNVSGRFLSLLGRGGVKAAPLAALAAVGAAAEPLVKQFVADDPNTYLTNENQQKGMLLSLLEREPPKVDDEILKWQTPALAGATAAGAIPGAGAVYKARRSGVPLDKSIGPLKEVGKTRAALGLSGVLGKALGASFSPLAVAATTPLSIAAERKGGTEWGDIATDPSHWIGPAFASSGAEMASKGIKNPMLLRALRLGMSSRALMLGSRFLGLPGLALTAGMWGYDKWKGKVDKDEEFRLRRYRDDDDE